MGLVKALTIWQPWASLIIAGAKPYEFRGWRCPTAMVGQRIVIHAAARPLDAMDTATLLRVLIEPRWQEEARRTCLIWEKAVPILERAVLHRLPRGCGIGTAVLGEPRLGTEIAAEFDVSRANDSDRDEHANWGWPMLHVKQWSEPVPMRGRQSFWVWPEPASVGL